MRVLNRFRASQSCFRIEGLKLQGGNLENDGNFTARDTPNGSETNVIKMFTFFSNTIG